MESYVKALSHHHRIDNIWGFIDGMFRPFCRPQLNQQVMYSGYKKLHGFKIQGITTPDGLLLTVDGPYEGKVNDISMVWKSGLEARLKEVCIFLNNLSSTLTIAMLQLFCNKPTPFYLYGDSTYKSCAYIFGPFTNFQSDPLKRRFNKRLSSAQISVDKYLARIPDYLR